MRTSLYAAGPVANGVLQGDLVLYGRGDPTFGRRCFATDTLREGACETDPTPGCASWPTGSALAASTRSTATWSATAATSSRCWCTRAGRRSTSTGGTPRRSPALGFNDNSVDFTWGPGTRPATPAVITMSPDVGDVVFENRTVTVPAGGESDIGDRFFREPGTLHVWAEGTAALDHPTSIESFAMPDPNLFTARALRQVLQEEGIAITGDHRLDDRLDALSPGPRHSPTRRDHLAPAPGMGIPDPQPEPELVRRDAAQAAGAAVRPWRVVDRRARRRTALPDRLGAGGLDRILAWWTVPGSRAATW